MTGADTTPRPGEAPLLELRDLHTAFRTKRGYVHAVDGIDLAVYPGETVGLVGESGCGKSAAARSILRLVPARIARLGPGDVVFDGQNLLDLGEEEMRAIRGQEIAMIFQDPMTSLNPVMTIGDQIGEGLRAHSQISKADQRARVIELLTLVGIPSPEDRMSWFPHQFSGGMRQRVVIAIALSCRPRVVLADEITTALDVTLQAQILDLLKSLAQSMQLATVLITHDLGVVAGMTQRVYVMYAGQIVETATTDELFARPAMPYTWGLLRSAPDLDAPDVDRLIPIEGLPPELVTPPKACRFASRCAYRREICLTRAPELSPPADAMAGHLSRCWGTQSCEDGGWLIGRDWHTDLGDEDIIAEIRDGEGAASRAGSRDSTGQTS